LWFLETYADNAGRRVKPDTPDVVASFEFVRVVGRDVMQVNVPVVIPEGDASIVGENETDLTSFRCPVRADW